MTSAAIRWIITCKPHGWPASTMNMDAIHWLGVASAHGARPPLRHIPGWEKFELNVRAAGPGARAGTDVALLHGAYFDAGPDLHGGDNQLTVYLRARDPRGEWNSTLFAKRGGQDR